MQNENTTDRSSWREIRLGKEKFQEIVKLLVEFDERSGRHSYAPLKECHFMRKAIALAEPEGLRILVRSYPGFLYYVAAELSNDQGMVTTCWVHEDGIKSERGDHDSEPDHPVHGILCLTDLFEQNEPIGEDEHRTLGELMQEYMERADFCKETESSKV